ncbi:hypothetical protein LCGC14_2989060 [marine sediment metagenome]|uniref:Uncharacterized protein n=1 Tax=marine sediment metagenome TaxID=412755 RepID=A0A0F8X4E9_9ZZZZ
MKTTKEQRAGWAARVNKHTGKPSYLPHGMVRRLIDDVDEATKWLRQQHEALAPNKKLPHSLCGVCTFLKEPSE